MAGNLELHEAYRRDWKQTRQSWPRAVLQRGLQVKVAFNDSIGPLFKIPARFNHSKFRPRARSRCHWACS
jgi:hypothetical protein